VGLRVLIPHDPATIRLWEYLYLTKCIVARIAIIVGRYDTSRDKFIDFEELKHMMEKLGCPQTHLALKEMIKEVDEDFDGKISFREVCVNYYSYINCSEIKE